MKLIWNDETNTGTLNEHTLNNKPNLGFEYCFLYFTEHTAQYMIDENTKTILEDVKEEVSEEKQNEAGELETITKTITKQVETQVAGYGFNANLSEEQITKIKEYIKNYIPPKPKEPTKEEIINRKLNELNIQRQHELDNAIIELDGIKLDADETSQTRMTRALAVLEDNEKQFWVAADDSMVRLTKVQFKQALKLAGLKQTAIWTKYAQLKQGVLNV